MGLRDLLPSFGKQPTPPGGNTPATQPTPPMLGHTPPAQDPGDIRPRAGAPPLGASGRANFAGLPQWDELNQKLTGQRGLLVFDDMYWTDAHIRRLVLAAWAPLVAATWTLEAYGDEEASDQDKEIADAIWWMLTEWMTPDFTGHLLEVGPSLIRFGFTSFEEQWDTVTYKGKTLIGPKKLGYMLPRTVWKWWQDDFGNLTHIGQVLPNKADVVVSASELVYYRLAPEGDNWMGRSLLRHAYKHWRIKDALERIQMIGCERSAKGVPIAYCSPDVHEDVRADLERLLANMHVSEAGYMIVPGWMMGKSPADAEPGNQFYIDVIQYNSSSDDAIKDAIDYHQTAISSSFLQDFLELGHHQVGARATADVQEDPFLTAVNGALLPPVLPPLNALIDRIRKLNWKDADGSPKLRCTLHDEASLSEIAAYVLPLVQADALQVDSDLEDWLRERAAMPAANPDVRKATEAARMAGLQNAAQMAERGETPGEEPPSPNAATAPAKPGQDEPPAASKSQPPPSKSQPTSQSSAKKKSLEQPDGPVAAGLIVHAKDTGRVLMIQRTDDKHDDDDTRARWEFGGGKLEDGETPWQGGLREWQEETGAKLPASAKQTGSFTTPDGKYRAFGMSIPREQTLKLGRHDPDEVADVQWWHPDDLHTDPRVRGKVQQMLPQVHQVLGGRTLDQAEAERRQTVCCDFDGVIHPNTPHDEPLSEPPIPGAVDGLKRLAQKYKVVICTARGADQLDDVRQWLERNGLGQFAAAVTDVKPVAVAYVDDRAVHFDGWGGVEAQVAKQLDAAAFAPMSGGVADASGLQMVPQVGGGCGCCDDCTGPGCGCCDDCSSERRANPKTPAPAGKQLDTAAEPTARWFDRLLSQDRLRDALDGARQHIETAVGPAALTAARKIASQSANASMDASAIASTEPPPELVDALTRHYEDMYQLGHQTVTLELAKQRAAMAKQLDEPPPVDEGAAAAGVARLRNARRRGEHSARNIVNAITGRVGRDQITALKDPAALQKTAEAAGTLALHMEALNNTAAVINEGRNDAGQSAPDVVGAVYTSVMDERSCDPCVAADTGQVMSPDEAVALGPPNPDCKGGDYCRCMLVWVLSNDPAAIGM